ncbi:MAG: DUF6456 domain-containing protein, partial [Sphingobium sp.]
MTRKGTERTIECVVEDADGIERKVRVNLAESPLSWLRARNLVSARQYDAGEKLRFDWEKAGMGARVTMRWDMAAAPARGRRGAAAPVEPGLASLAARDRLHGALTAAGPGLKDILWRVVCACEGLAAAESALGWPS